MRTHPHLVHPRQQSLIGQQSQQQQSSYLQQTSRSAQEMHHNYGAQHTQKRPFVSAGSTYLPQQRSFSSSEEELRSTPEFDGEFIVLVFLFLVSLFFLNVGAILYIYENFMTHDENFYKMMSKKEFR